jgi:hypothetical protein
MILAGMRNVHPIWLAGILLLTAASISAALPASTILLQDSVQRQQSATSLPAGSPHREVFEKVQEGLSAANIALFSRYFSSQVLVNLRGGESGYYSASQVYYLLENYLKPRKLARFSFSTIAESGNNPYATGSVAFNYRGNREYAQVYVSLSKVGDRWMITQINIY